MVGNGERVPLTGLLRFDPADPIAISLVIRVTSGQTVEWTFARDLLVAGGDRPMGVGEVRVRPSQGAKGRVLALTLTSPDGPAELELPSQRVDTFVRQTYAAIPSEMEADLIDWPSEFAWLLGPEDRSTGT
ncbi:SsgA family sporulation/cell division regulator [Frankia sp. AgB1.9]|uniref:SsgA family sporulation/cell division regulator n=1 Tax=unclassified Frankia TaxID=2632575 RepID=UPI00193143EB|nr:MULTISPECIES: SsgA family sporulation/cell division regulator [unclassified Frankia]MBL7488014.1 SsgA family sporulation/cell division regulator [Frankia sp. AgW1.1]MBL7549452.1 SsgA family sporulation/cell division regulator [Frankia sp. AgB1.9]MBL7619932.1 SsgA family sporulation/cell division regulator [Frankia sp. AgB1.8]